MGTIYGDQVVTMVCRALNMMDDRLVDHGLRVALIIKDMLKTEEDIDQELGRSLGMIALFHDVGAYRQQEIDKLIQFEVSDIWEHAIYGYLFLKEFSPLKELSKVVLYHHADCNICRDEPEVILKYAQWLHVADRAEIWYRTYHGENQEKFIRYLQDKSGIIFSVDAVECFLRANEQYGTIDRLAESDGFEDILECHCMKQEEVEAYMELLVHSIDFRSSFTVTHTAAVSEIACQLAGEIGLPEKEKRNIHYGALLHDIGKIGTPTAILEKEGKLTPDEMNVMREHIALGREIIEGCVNDTIANIALRHHERLDGTGYPLGLSAKDLTLPERILTIADIASALCMKRSYKEAFPKEEVFSILDGMRDRGWIDGSILEILEREYDEIVGQAEKVCIPLREINRKIAEDYEKISTSFQI